MIDVVVNNIMATSTKPDYSQYFFKNAVCGLTISHLQFPYLLKSFYHPYCSIQWGNITSEQSCWLGDQNVPLPDVDTTNPTVIEEYGEWIQNLIQEYDIDGLRIDGAFFKLHCHVNSVMPLVS